MLCDPKELDHTQTWRSLLRLLHVCLCGGDGAVDLAHHEQTLSHVLRVILRESISFRFLFPDNEAYFLRRKWMQHRHDRS
jgi:hypothetical protein